MYVAYYILVAFCLIKISIIGFILYGLPMPQMVMAGHVIPAFRQIFAQFPVSFYILHHAVANLQHAFYLTFRNPFHRVDLGFGVSGGVVKLIFHLSVFHSNIISVGSQRLICRTYDLIYVL